VAFHRILVESFLSQAGQWYMLQGYALVGAGVFLSPFGQTNTRQEFGFLVCRNSAGFTMVVLVEDFVNTLGPDVTPLFRAV
jgi:hypothetical protein